MRRRWIALAGCLALAGCAGGTPDSAQVKSAARAWAQDHLHPHTLEVTNVSVRRSRTASVSLRADGRPTQLRLRQRDGDWVVVSARP
jgi:hypothetical protein